MGGRARVRLVEPLVTVGRDTRSSAVIVFVVVVVVDVVFSHWLIIAILKSVVTGPTPVILDPELEENPSNGVRTWWCTYHSCRKSYIHRPRCRSCPVD